MATFHENLVQSFHNFRDKYITPTNDRIDRNNVKNEFPIEDALIYFKYPKDFYGVTIDLDDDYKFILNGEYTSDDSYLQTITNKIENKYVGKKLKVFTNASSLGSDSFALGINCYYYNEPGGAKVKSKIVYHNSNYMIEDYPYIQFQISGIYNSKKAISDVYIGAMICDPLSNTDEYTRPVLSNKTLTSMLISNTLVNSLVYYTSNGLTGTTLIDLLNYIINTPRFVRYFEHMSVNDISVGKTHSKYLIRPHFSFVGMFNDLPTSGNSFKIDVNVLDYNWVNKSGGGYIEYANLEVIATMTSFNSSTTGNQTIYIRAAKSDSSDNYKIKWNGDWDTISYGSDITSINTNISNLSTDLNNTVKYNNNAANISMTFSNGVLDINTTNK